MANVSVLGLMLMCSVFWSCYAYGVDVLVNDTSAPVFARQGKMRKFIVHPVLAPLTLNCKAYGNPRPSVVWLKDGKVLDTADFNTPDYWSIKLKAPRSEDSGNYTCVVSNKQGTINFTYIVNVVEMLFPHRPLVYDIHPENLTVGTGEQVKFCCRFTGANFLSVQWFYYSAASNFSHGTKIERENSSNVQHGKHLVLSSVTIEDSGRYDCVVSNLFGEAKRSAWLTVLPPLSAHAVSTPERLYLDFFLLHAALVALAGFAAICGIRRVQSRKSNEGVDDTDEDQEEALEKLIVDSEQSRLAESDEEYHRLERLHAPVQDDSLLFNEHFLPVDYYWEFPRERLVFRRVVAKGAFSLVVKAVAYEVVDDGPQTVAVKMLKDVYSAQDIRSLASEMNIMKRMGYHSNVIGLLGCCTENGLPYIMMEYAARGTLKDFLTLRSTGNYTGLPIQGLTVSDLLFFAVQIASGMNYLTQQKIIHCDLAARNILVTKDWVIKISGFRHARVLDGDRHSVTTEEMAEMMDVRTMPFKWVAPEALTRNVFTYSSDVWSFGVVLWELLSHGSMPYESINNWLVLAMCLQFDYRLGRPERCPKNVYNLMLSCWHEWPKFRPSFSEIESILAGLSMDADQQYYSTAEAIALDGLTY